MSPDRRGREPYKGPERRKAHRRREDLPPIKHGPFTTWQWAVIALFFAVMILSSAIGSLAHRADHNADRGNAAICVEVGFLRNGIKTAEQAIRQHPEAPENPARQESISRLEDLIAQLEASVPSCRDALK